MRAELTQSWELLEEGRGHMGGLLLRAWAGGWRQGEDRVRMAGVGVSGCERKRHQGCFPHFRLEFQVWWRFQVLSWRKLLGIMGEDQVQIDEFGIL